jgi:precorrin-2 methylase
MAVRFYGVDLGGSRPEEVTEQATTTSKYVDVQVVYDATGNAKSFTLQALQAVMEYIVRDTWPPV